jgi:nitroreductase
VEKILPVFRQRYSCRSYNGEIVSRENLITCIEAARQAPSACNSQPARFFVTNKKDLIKDIADRGMGKLIPNKWLINCGAIVVIANDIPILSKVGSLISSINYNEIDSGIAGEHLVLQASVMGIGSCWIGWFKEKEIKKIMDIPKNLKIVSIISLGFPEKKGAPARKKEISEIMFFR